MFPRNRQNSAAAGFICLLAHCQYNSPYIDEFTEVASSKADLVGFYVLTNKTLVHGHALMGDNPYIQASASTAKNGIKASVHKLILRADGTFTAVNVPLRTGGFSEGWSIKNFQNCCREPCSR
jgi:hypothetical protein